MTYLTQRATQAVVRRPSLHSSKFIMSETHPKQDTCVKGALDWNLGTHQSLGRRDEADVMSHQMLRVKRG